MIAVSTPVLRRTVLTALLCGLAGCDRLETPVTVATQQDAAAVTMTVTMVKPWDEIVADLEPRFARMSEDDALKASLPVTSRLAVRMADAFAANIEAGLPGTARTVERATTLAPGSAPATNETITRRSTPGTLPQNPGAISGAPTASSLTPAPGSDFAVGLGVDPLLHYGAAASLMQEVALLNRSLRAAAMRHRFVPYVVRIQVGVVPLRRRLAYDTWLELAFFTGSADEMRQALAPSPDAGQARNADLRPPYVLPVLVTDNLEQQSSTRVLDQLRQFSAAASAMVQGVALGGGLQAQRQVNQALAGAEQNSLLSVSRLVDNVVQVRLGAPLQTGARFAMIPRTHNLTFLVLMPDDYVRDRFAVRGGGEGAYPRFQVLMHSTLRDASSGEVLPQRSLEGELRTKLAGVVPAADLVRLTAVRPDGGSALGDLRSRVHGNNRLADAAPIFHRAGIDGGGAIGWLMPVWTALAAEQARGNYNAATIELPRPATPFVPPETVVALRRGGNGVVAEVAGARAIDPARWQAVLSANTGGRRITFASEALAFDTETGVLTVSFPAIDAPWPRAGGRPVVWAGAELAIRERPYTALAYDNSVGTPDPDAPRTWRLRTVLALPAAESPRRSDSPPAATSTGSPSVAINITTPTAVAPAVSTEATR